VGAGVVRELLGTVQAKKVAGADLRRAVPDRSSLRRVGDTFAIVGRGLRYKLHVERSDNAAPAR
jgi:hypothetical protein